MQIAGIPSMLLLLITLVAGSCSTTSQTATQEKTTKSYSMATRDWVFTANSANPQSGRVRQLSSDYTVTLTSTKLIANLPYYGQATAGADLFSGHGPLDFTSTDFVSDSRTTSKGALNIVIKPRDYNEVQSLDFTFYDNGTAYLSVIMLHRSSISFTGSVEQIKS